MGALIPDLCLPSWEYSTESLTVRPSAHTHSHTFCCPQTPAPTSRPNPRHVSLSPVATGNAKQAKVSLKLGGVFRPVKCFVTTTRSLNAACYYFPDISASSSQQPGAHVFKHMYLQYPLDMVEVAGLKGTWVTEHRSRGLKKNQTCPAVLMHPNLQSEDISLTSGLLFFS